jgi:hypothetical protein
MFGGIENQEDKKYTTKIQSPIYEPKNLKPHVLELYDNQKTKRLIREIDSSALPIEEKIFLVDAARRHTIFNYEKIADYYANSSKEMQEFMERSALVIVDFEKAIQNGYVRLCDDIKKQYLEEYE